jgi:tetratricopeptide (TPR) repeat protein
MARTGLQAVRAISPAPITLPSHSTVLTGMVPPWHGVRENGIFRLEDSLSTIPELLPEDVATGAFVGSVVLAEKYNLSQGFDTYNDDFSGTDATGEGHLERTAGEVFSAASDWLAGFDPDDRIFLWTHVFDPHYPYRAPAPWPGTALEAYDAEVAYTDHQLGRFLRSLGDGNPSRLPLVLVTADHGESLGGHGELTHSLFVYDDTQHIPLLVTGTAAGPQRLDPSLRSLLDVPATLLDFFDGSPPDARRTGESLFRPALSETAYVETLHTELYRGWSPLYGVRTPDWKYIRAPRPELYDLCTDPGETVNLHAERPEIVGALSSALDRILLREVPVHALAPETEAMAELRSLGYVATVRPGRRARRLEGAKDPKDGVKGSVALFRGEQAILDGDLVRAERYFTQTIRLDPECKEAHSFLAGVYFTWGRYPLAADYARRALELPPDMMEAPIYATLGEIYLAMGRPKDAVAPLKKAVQLAPRSERNRNLLAEAERAPR